MHFTRSRAPRSAVTAKVRSFAPRRVRAARNRTRAATRRPTPALDPGVPVPAVSADAFPTVEPNSVVRRTAHGVLRLNLAQTDYQWSFIPVAGESFTDSGSGNCH